MSHSSNYPSLCCYGFTFNSVEITFLSIFFIKGRCTLFKDTFFVSNGPPYLLFNCTKSFVFVVVGLFWELTRYVFYDLQGCYLHSDHLHAPLVLFKLVLKEKKALMVFAYLSIEFDYTTDTTADQLFSAMASVETRPQSSVSFSLTVS